MKKPSKKAIQKMSDALCDIDPLLVLEFDNYQKYVDELSKERDYYKSLCKDLKICK